MSYFDGFVVAVPKANKAAYLALAGMAAPIFAEFGMTRMVEAWEDDVPDGELTDFRRAVKATAEEAIVFSWCEYPDRATRDAANAKMHSDPRIAEMMDMPFDGKRMIYSGFAPLGPMPETIPAGYVNGCLIPVKTADRAAFEASAANIDAVFRDAGALRSTDGWGDDLMRGEVTDFLRAIAAEEGETCVFSIVEWPSKAAHDAGWPRIMADPRMPKPGDPMPFDGRRMVFGGFTPIFDTLTKTASAAE
ncbi:Uncharacterized conserved protein YbaA, DUF1428 family [Albimonas donghaensis]|uniref:Uncharacterized conserved protein YbaA, DUF1428 family n=1 Tax=Albimonas donghaensis TaxID=356660 RepID=A0A1H3AFU0_9RHOB|nr:DUF1428 domain-containing protein [Albimonas donghaensis]SDX28597.1 Uncharacterized conserved protein YbaA, DUF1428 family [Albimonas donghaensis]